MKAIKKIKELRLLVDDTACGVACCRCPSSVSVARTKMKEIATEILSALEQEQKPLRHKPECSVFNDIKGLPCDCQKPAETELLHFWDNNKDSFLCEAKTGQRNDNRYKVTCVECLRLELEKYFKQLVEYRDESDRQAKEIKDTRLELGLPITAGTGNMPLHEVAAMVVCELLRMQSENAELKKKNEELVASLTQSKKEGE